MKNNKNSAKMNWYLKQRIYNEVNKDIYQEAGMKENLLTGLLGALVLLISGYTISNASKQTGVAEDEIIQATQDEGMVERAKNIINQGKLNTMSLGGLSPHELHEPKKPNTNDKEKSRQMEIAENIIARTIYAEGRSESSEGRRAIATVIYNRGGSPSGMVKAIQVPKQFSCWNKADADDWNNMKKGEGDTWEDSVNIAKSMVNGTFSPTGTYDHYYNPNKCNPSWAYEKDSGITKLRPYDDIGNHRFMTIGKWAK